MGKQEIARNEQFLLFPLCFQKAFFSGASKGVIVWEWVNPSRWDQIFDWSKLKAISDHKLNVIEKLKFVLERVEKIVGKGENAGFDMWESSQWL